MQNLVRVILNPLKSRKLSKRIPPIVHLKHTNFISGEAKNVCHIGNCILWKVYFRE